MYKLRNSIKKRKHLLSVQQTAKIREAKRKKGTERLENVCMKIPRRCPVCKSTRITHNEKGEFKCKKCGYAHKKSEELSYKTYGG